MVKFICQFIFGKPKIGAIYRFKTSDPFEDAWEAEVLDYREGWVKYKTYFHVETAEYDTFLFCYKRVKR